MKGSRLIGGPGVSLSTPKASQQDIKNLEQDLKTLNSKLCDLTGENIQLSNSSAVPSPFVNSMRGLGGDKSSPMESMSDIKMNLMEQVLKKITELDRAILKKTIPEGISNDTSIRRQSRGSDLFTIPTHLHITDRLLDLHTQSKRVTVIRQTINGPGQDKIAHVPVDLPSPMNLSPRVSKREIDSLQSTINKLTKQLAESSEAQLKSNDECNLLKKELESSKKETNNFKLEIEKLKNEMKSNKGNIENEEKMNKTIDGYKLQLSELNDKLLLESKKYENICKTIRDISNDMVNMSNSQTLVTKGSFDKSIESNNLAVDGKTVIYLLESSILQNIESMSTQISTLHSIKEVLEDEVKTYIFNLDLLNQDLGSVASEHEALKGAYHALESEFMIARQNKGKGDATMGDKLDAANELLEQLQAELAAMTRRSMELEKLPQIIAECEGRLRESEEVRYRIDSKNNEMITEIKNLKKSNEKLIQKIRDMSGKNNDAKDFLDSFEEVMRDEMLAMKEAFEAKLKAAKDEQLAASRRHQDEISRVQATSPLASLTVGMRTGASMRR